MELDLIGLLFTFIFKENFYIMASRLSGSPVVIIKMFTMNLLVSSYLMSLFSVDSFEKLGFCYELVLVSSWMMLSTNQGRRIQRRSR